MALAEVYHEDRPRIEIHDDSVIRTREELARANKNICNHYITLAVGVERKRREMERQQAEREEYI